MIDSLEEVYKSMEDGAYDFTDNGKCTSCGQCCTAYLPISRAELREIERYVKKHHIKPCNHKDGAPVVNANVLDMICPFRDNVHKVCTIYAKRPLICKDFKCDKPKKRIEADKKLIATRRTVVNMWGLFA